ncbi:FusB/FusC family EF-G-binding protein [Aquibacillus kalidii]|uniref:FusB/FusC family EF-G-binding protein n=1 Tax=Aquibacillus kalidii TaxID=2762597 RepID=UPI0016454440|nr:FusB/FusC family EF-G-binding protein [Aquibacillus kalidii]
MEPFIKSFQYNFIRKQVMHIVNSKATVNDADVIQAVKSIAEERVLALFPELNEQQIQLLTPIQDIKDKEEAESFLVTMKKYVIPFKTLTESTIKKLFPKIKKLKAPATEDIDLRETTYISWRDAQSNKTFIVADYRGKLVGLVGTFHSLNQKGICTICNGHEEVGMYTAEKKGANKDSYVKRGNYICKDSVQCNINLQDLDRLYAFIQRLKN